jgi:multiple sugar transport system permease protein
MPGSGVQVPPIALGGRRPRWTSASVQRHLFAYLSLLPATLVVALFTLYPTLYSLNLALHQYHLLRPGRHPFVGVRNFVEALNTPGLYSSLLVTLQFTAMSVAGTAVLGTLIALLLNQPFRLARVLQVAILIPWAIPAVMAGIIWRWVFRGDVGVLNGLLYSLGLIESYRSFLGDPITAKLALVIAHLWKHLPLATILLLATLQVIPRELYDAAKLDGAGTWQLFRSITFPFLKPTLAVVLIFDTIVAFTTFDLVFAMTGGGPANATTLIAWYIYNEIFTNLNLGRGAALAFLVALVTLVLALVYLRALRTERFYREG